MKIAVYSPNWVGDATLSLPFINALKSQNFESEIIVICRDWVSPVYQNNESIDNIISLTSLTLSFFGWKLARTIILDIANIL